MAQVIATGLQTHQITSLSLSDAKFVSSSVSNFVFKAIAESRVTDLHASDLFVPREPSFPPPGWNYIENSKVNFNEPIQDLPVQTLAELLKFLIDREEVFAFAKIFKPVTESPIHGVAGIYRYCFGSSIEDWRSRTQPNKDWRRVEFHGDLNPRCIEYLNRWSGLLQQCAFNFLRFHSNPELLGSIHSKSISINLDRPTPEFLTRMLSAINPVKQQSLSISFV